MTNFNLVLDLYSMIVGGVVALILAFAVWCAVEKVVRFWKGRNYPC